MIADSPHNHPVIFEEQESPLSAEPSEVVHTDSGIEERREGTRSSIAFILSALLTGLFLGVAIVYLLDITDTANHMDQLMSTVVNSTTTIFASVIGYYFGSERK